MKGYLAKRFLGSAAALALGWLGVAETAGAAATVEADYTGFFGEAGVGITLNGVSRGTGFGAGILKFDRTAGTYNSVLQPGQLDVDKTAEFVAFCIAPNINLRDNPPIVFEAVSLSDGAAAGTRADSIGKLLNVAFESGKTPWGWLSNDSNKAKAAGLQIAIWEVLTETESMFAIDEGNSRFTASNAAKTYATGLLAKISGGSVWQAYESIGLVALSPTPNQNMMGWIEPGRTRITSTDAPLPGTLALLGLGLMAIGLQRRRRSA